MKHVRLWIPLLAAIGLLFGCHDHPVPDDVTAPQVRCLEEDGSAIPYACQSMGFCADPNYLANTPATGQCGSTGLCEWPNPTSLTECQCGCVAAVRHDNRAFDNRCGNCGSTAY